MFIEYNPNPAGRRVGDCVIRAITKVTGKPWEHVYIGLLIKGLRMYDMPSSNGVWAVMDELMDTLAVMNPRLYNGVMRRLREA